MLLSITQQRLLAINMATAALAGLLMAHELRAETWTDVSGKFQIEAEYVGVEGKDVVLRRANNTTVRVPISRLSEASRTQAKRLYDLAKSDSKPASAVTPVSPPKTKLDRPSDEAPLTARALMAGMITGFVDRGLDPLRNATTQAEFDQAVTELAAVMSLLQRGGANGAVPPPPAFR